MQVFLPEVVMNAWGVPGIVHEASALLEFIFSWRKWIIDKQTSK